MSVREKIGDLEVMTSEWKQNSFVGPTRREIDKSSMLIYPRPRRSKAVLAVTDVDIVPRPSLPCISLSYPLVALAVPYLPPCFFRDDVRHQIAKKAVANLFYLCTEDQIGSSVGPPAVT